MVQENSQDNIVTRLGGPGARAQVLYYATVAGRIDCDYGYYSLADLIDKVSLTLGDIGEYANVLDRYNFPWRIEWVIAQLRKKPVYAVIPAPAISALYADAKTYPEFKAALLHLFSQHKIMLTPDMTAWIKASDHEYANITCAENLYSFAPYVPGTLDIPPGSESYFASESELFSHMLSLLEHYGILIDEQEITNFIATGGDENFKKIPTPEVQEKILAEMGEIIGRNKWVWPQAAAALAA